MSSIKAIEQDSLQSGQKPLETEEKTLSFSRKTGARARPRPSLETCFVSRRSLGTIQRIPFEENIYMPILVGSPWKYCQFKVTFDLLFEYLREQLAQQGISKPISDEPGINI